ACAGVFRGFGGGGGRGGSGAGDCDDAGLFCGLRYDGEVYFGGGIGAGSRGNAARRVCNPERENRGKPVANDRICVAVGEQSGVYGERFGGVRAGGVSIESSGGCGGEDGFRCGARVVVAEERGGIEEGTSLGF